MQLERFGASSDEWRCPDFGRKHPMKRIAFSLVAVATLAGVIGSVANGNHPTRARIRQSHGQNDAELRLAAHHSGVSVARLFKRIGFDHGTYARELGEVHCVFRIGWCSCRPSLNGFASGNELERCDLNRVERGADYHEFAVRAETVNQLGHSL